MVDVGYHLSFCGHKVIENVEMIDNRGDDSTFEDIMVFFSHDTQETYILNRCHIDWIIPHEDIEATSIPYVEQPFIKSKTVQDAINEFNKKPITNKEKFKEVFGYEPHWDLGSVCAVVDCDGVDCENCRYNDGHTKWDDEWRG